MVYLLQFLVAVLVSKSVNLTPIEYSQPEQIHLSFADGPPDVVVTWVTKSNVPESIVQYGESSFESHSISGECKKFIDGGKEHRVLWIHSAKMANLRENATYVYRVGSQNGWSSVYRFKTVFSSPNWSPKIAIFGDMGNEGSVIMGSLQTLAEKRQIDAIFHIGDFAYDMRDDNGRVGDVFMNQIEPVATVVPYMTCVGNHEEAYNFSNYKNRFKMPGATENMFYSYNLGPVHIVSISTEYYYFYKQYGWLQIAEQYKWLENDLAEANKPENRLIRPWIIVGGHRPMYCSTNDSPTGHCNNVENIVRVGLPNIHAYGLEKLFYRHGVDLQFYAHEHNYERMWPVYNRTVCNGTSGDPYLNPQAPVHVITGSGGNKEGQTKFDRVLYPWSAFHSDDFGFTILKIKNKKEIHIQQYSASLEKNPVVIDEFVLRKTRENNFNCQKTDNILRFIPKRS